MTVQKTGLLSQVWAWEGKISGGSGPQKVTARDRAAKRFRADQDVEEEGEISDTDEGGAQPMRGRGRNKDTMDRQSEEEKWHDWCAQMMEDQSQALERLQKLQTNFSLPKEEVLRRVKTYLQTLGRKIDHILAENSAAPTNLDRMVTWLWNYVPTFSNLKGDKLAEIYKKLRQEAPPDPVRGASQDPNHSGAAGPSGRDEHSHPPPNRRQAQVGNTSAQVGEPSRGDAEPWKRRQREDPPGGPPNGPHNATDRRKWDGLGREKFLMTATLHIWRTVVVALVAGIAIDAVEYPTNNGVIKSANRIRACHMVFGCCMVLIYI